MPRTVCDCQPVSVINCGMEAPPTLSSSVMTCDCLLGSGADATGSCAMAVSTLTTGSAWTLRDLRALDGLDGAPAALGFLTGGDALDDLTAAERGLAGLAAAALALVDFVAVDLVTVDWVVVGFEEGVEVLRFMNISGAERGTGGSNALCKKLINYGGQ